MFVCFIGNIVFILFLLRCESQIFLFNTIHVIIVLHQKFDKLYLSNFKWCFCFIRKLL